MPGFRAILGSAVVQKVLGAMVADYLRLVWKTSSYAIEPAALYDDAIRTQPVIITMWHGQHFMVPFIRRHHPAKVLVSRHRDGEINAIAATRLGVGTIRGSGAAGGRFDVKGGVGAFAAMRDALAAGCNVAMTADVPKIARVAGMGVIRLAQVSARPIYPVAIASSRRKVLGNWDRTTINLPFSRIALTVGDPIHVPESADEATREACRKTLESTLETITARGYALVDKAGDSRG